MANYAKISTLSSHIVNIDINAKPQTIVDLMISQWQQKIGQVLPDKPDLIVVPEMCDGLGNCAPEKLNEYYNIRKDQIFNSFCKIANSNNCYIVYPAIRQISGNLWYNSIIVIDRQGKIAGIYDKHYPTMPEMENEGILPGKNISLIECDFGKIACAICFDLNFDALRLKYKNLKPDLIIFSSMYHGGIAQAWWAYSCRCHFVSAITGLMSEIRNPHGNTIAATTNYFDFVTATVNLDCRLVQLGPNWEKLTAIKAKYGTMVQIHDPGYYSSVIVSSLQENLSTDEILAEFSIESIDAYLERCSTYCNNKRDKKL
jgi:hypothetical protein